MELESKVGEFFQKYFGSYGEKIGDIYGGIESEAKENIGNPVLAVYQEESEGLKRGNHPYTSLVPSLVHFNTTLTLGILNSAPELNYENGRIVFPTSKHVISRSNYKNKKWMPRDDSVSLANYEFFYLDEEFKRSACSESSGSLDLPECKLKIIFGENVNDYFSKGGFLDTSYVEALNLLGHDAPSNFQEKYNEKIFKEKFGIISSLENLMQQERVLIGGIESIFRSVRSGGFISGGAATFIENEDDAKIVSLDSRDKLDDVRREIRRNLKRGIEIGMCEESSKVELRPGVEINVPNYIGHLSSRYKIDGSK